MYMFPFVTTFSYYDHLFYLCIHLSIFCLAVHLSVTLSFCFNMYLSIFLLKGNQNPHTYMYQVYFYYKVLIIENNRWKFEQNQAKNKEVTALWNLAISRGRYSKWWQVVDNSPYVLYMNLHVFPLFWWLKTISFSEIKIWQARMYSTWHIMKSGHENTRIERKFKKN